MKARLVLDDHMLGGGVAVGDLPEEVPAEVQADGGHEAEPGPVFEGLQRPVDILPFVALLLGDHQPLAPQGPVPPSLDLESEAGLIGHPDIHRPVLGQPEACQPLLQPGGERRRGRRILFDVAGTRNPERAAHFSQPAVGRFDRPPDAVGLPQPARHPGGGAPVAGLESGPQFGLRLRGTYRAALANGAPPVPAAGPRLTGHY